RPRARGQRQRGGERGECESGPPHASVRLPVPPSSAAMPTTSATPPRTSATIASVEVPPPPSELLASIVGAGASELSGPVQSTTLPFVYVWRTSKVYVLLASVLARNEKVESSPVGTLPPSHVTLVISAFSPEPVCWTLRFQPGEGTNESIPKPFGSVSSILVVDAFDSSVGTARVNSSRS